MSFYISSEPSINFSFIHFGSLGFSISTTFPEPELLLQCFGRLGIQYGLKCGERVNMEIRRLLLKCIECIMTKNNEKKSVRRRKGNTVWNFRIIIFYFLIVALPFYITPVKIYLSPMRWDAYTFYDVKMIPKHN